MPESTDLSLRQRLWRPSPRIAAAMLLTPAAVAIGELVFHYRLFGNWTRFANDLIWFGIAAGLAVSFRGWWRDVLGWAAGLMLCFAGAEAYTHYRLSSRLVAVTGPSVTTRDPVLGWRLGSPGRYRHSKIDPRTGQAVFDVEYTVGADRTRQVLSSADGPLVAFFGDSLMFGEGVPDAETLPQLFADLTGRHLRVLNFGVQGYGPQQLLRTLETGVYDDLLSKPHALVFETSAWHAVVADCVPEYAMDAPRYLLIDDKPVIRGQCGDRWSWLIGRLFTVPMYTVFLEPVLSRPSRAKIDLYVAVMARAVALSREKFAAPIVVLYLPSRDFPANSGITDERIMARLRAAGLTVVDGRLDPGDFPGELLTIPNEGHPTGVANRARAARVLRALNDLGLLSN